MNKKEGTKLKGSKVNANNDPSEVFVLPPNLLEALGINLRNIETAPECTSGNQISEKDLTHTENSTKSLGTPHNFSEMNNTTSSEIELSVTNTAGQNLFSKDKFTGQGTFASIPETNYTTSSKNETSIIHTANLMKASVFLSPTFISNNSSIIEGEVEILGSDKLVENAIPCIPNTCSNNEECDQNDCMTGRDTCPNQHQQAFTVSNLENFMTGGDTCPNQHQQAFTVSNLENSSDANSSETVQDKNQDVQSTDVHVKINNLAKDVNFDDHADEAYLSDGSNDNDYVNQNAVAGDRLDNHLNILSDVSEDIVIDTEMQEGSSQHVFKGHESEYTDLVLLNTLNYKEKCNIVETYISDPINTNKIATNNEEIELNETLQNGGPNALEIQNFYINRNSLPSITENVTISTQMHEVSSQHEFEVQKSMFDIHVVCADTINCEDRGRTMETIVSDVRSTNTFTTKFDEENEKAAMQKVNPNVLDEQNVYIDGNKVSSENDDIVITAKNQEGSSRQAFEEHKKELDSQLVLPETLDRANGDNIKETNISETKTANTITTNYEEQKIIETLEKIVPSAVDEQNFHAVDKHHILTKAVPDKVKTKPTKVKDKNIKTLRDAKRKQVFACVKDSNLSQTNVNKQKLNKVNSKQVVKKVLKRTRHRNTNLKIKNVLVKAKSKPTQKEPPEECPKELCNSCILPDSNTKIIQQNNKSLSTGTADHSIQLGRLGTNNEVQEDKIREIAGYLRKFAELQKQRGISKKKQNVSSIKIFTNKKHVTNTKLSIQGVEKPGGLDKGKDLKSDKNVKTYERKRINKTPVKVLWNNPNFDTHTEKINLSINSSYNTCEDTDFCLCDDFGRLVYYDDDESMYEHIHFWNRKQVDCTPDHIFSIYNENVSVDVNNDDDAKNLQDYAYIPIENFCASDRKSYWKEMNFMDCQGFNEEGSEHIVISSRERIETNSLNIDKLSESSVDKQMKPDASKGSRSPAKNTENGHKKAIEVVSVLENCQEMINNNIVPAINPMKNEKKRKYSSTFNRSDKLPVNQHVTDSELPALVKSGKIVKKQKCSEEKFTEKIVPGDQPDSEGSFAISLNKDTSAVCGVCQQNIKETDWFKHIASQHNYLSWRVDEEPLDLKNRQLLIQHLASLIKQHGMLSCNKCGTTRKYAKPFLQHINQCATVEQNQCESILPSSEFNSKSNPLNYASIGSSSIHNTRDKKHPEPQQILVECGVCGESIHEKDWNSHIGSQHNYLALKKGEQTLDIDDGDKVKEHLNNIVKECGGLKCAKCGLIRKYVKSYQTHIKSCDGQSLSESLNESSKGFLHIVSEVDTVRYVSNPVNNVSTENEAELITEDLIKCGVCGEFMHSKAWNSHIGSQHNYLAWKHGESTLDVDDEVAVKEHLYNIAKDCGGLKCAKCGLTRKYVKSYQTHIRSCDGMSESISGCATNTSMDFSEIEPAQDVNDLIRNVGIKNEEDTTTEIIQCAVCGDSMPNNNWYDHIGYQHNYLAWRCGDLSLDFDDEEATHKHLYAITKEYGGLKCVKCGLNRKYVKSYLTHVKSCTGLSDSQIDSTINESLNISEVEPAKVISNSITNLTFENEVNGILIKCGVCEQIVQNNSWYNHTRLEHNYLAWKYGEPALDVDNEDAVREHLNNIIKEFGKLNCTKCGITRKHVRSYLTHVKNCTGLSRKDDNPIADDSTPNIVVLSEAEQHKKGLTKCGVCGQYMPLTDWMAHIEGKHSYLAWKDGEIPLDMNDKAELRAHLKNIVKELGMLVCVKCGTQRKFAKSYLQHIEQCDGSEEAANSSKVTDEVIWPAAGADQVKCGVCDELVQASLWIKHIAEQHDYLAKKVGETPLDVDDEEQVYKHLYKVAKDNEGLVCQKCGTERKYVKCYLEHIRKCGQDLSVSADTTFEADTTLDTSECLVDFYSGGTCGVCDNEVETGKWVQHIQKKHNYLAWRKGEKPWDLDDFNQVNEYLYEITKRMGGLTCNKCGLVRKYVKSYLTHIKSCDVVDFNLTSFVPDGVGPVSDKAYRCAMCQKEIEPSNWKNHAMKEHYNITWIIGETPIDIKNPYAVEKYLKEYKQSHSLKCNNCGATRASFAGFYAHIITCGKTEEQIEMFQSVCDICNNKYLCIYKNQHMMIHRVQSYNKELKMSKENVETASSGKRRAAQKARTVIETYGSDMSQHSHRCSTCGFGTDFKEELQSHRCEVNEKDFSEEESSAVEGEGSEDESADSEVDSDISREEEDQLQTLKRKRFKEPVSGASKLSKIYFKVDDPNAFVEQSDIDFCNAFFTDETLFPKWISCKGETVSEIDLPKYLPPMEQSCKVQAGFEWTTLKRFEAKSGDGTIIFVGASIVCISWVPLRVEDIMGDGHNFLAVACHNDVDCPRYECDETPQHENLIQIWDFGACTELPRIVYGIAHDFGTVWSMDWCPSGARDVLPEKLSDGQSYRLGLLAVACSNGSTYIFSVPHPSAVVENNYFIQKLKPVAELRMKMLSERKIYQATSVSWSKEKGHEIILVGYADGSTGYYDINNNSPLSWRVEDGVDIFFPFNEERPHNTCITATDMVPRLGGGVVACSASATGAEMSIPGAGVRVRSQLPARAAIFAPHWPATLLAGDTAIMSTAVNELEWTQPARKLGGVRALAGCARCGRVAAAAPPALRVMRPHPAYPEFRKPIIGMIEMIPLAKKTNKQVNDELAMKIEPLTYPEAIIKYGIQFQSVSKRDKVLQQQCASKPKSHFPERFPLADVESMAFCPAKLHHDRLAVATHSGIVFFTNVNL